MKKNQSRMKNSYQTYVDLCWPFLILFLSIFRPRYLTWYRLIRYFLNPLDAKIRRTSSLASWVHSCIVCVPQLNFEQDIQFLQKRLKISIYYWWSQACEGMIIQPVILIIYLLIQKCQIYPILTLNESNKHT